MLVSRCLCATGRRPGPIRLRPSGLGTVHEVRTQNFRDIDPTTPVRDTFNNAGVPYSRVCAGYRLNIPAYPTPQHRYVLPLPESTYIVNGPCINSSMADHFRNKAYGYNRSAAYHTTSLHTTTSQFESKSISNLDR